MMKAQAAAQERAEQSVGQLLQEVSRTHQEEMASLVQQNEKVRWSVRERGGARGKNVWGRERVKGFHHGSPPINSFL
jgi:hypothetical protein